MEYICRICGNNQGNPGFVAREMFFGSREEFHYFQCSSCDCLQIAAVPSDLSRHYPADYYSFSDPEKYTLKQMLKNMLFKRRNLYALTGQGPLGRWINSILPADIIFAQLKAFNDPLGRSILDVGCGNGALLYQLKELGFKIVLGLDPFIHQDIIYHNGLKIRKENLVQFAAHQLKFDVVMFNHSFEHMPDPVDQLAHASSILNHDGTIMIVTPTVTSYAWKHYGIDWVQMDPPRHLFLYSVKAMEILAAKAGLRVAEVIYNSTELQFWGSEQYQKGIPLEATISYKNSSIRSMFSRADIKNFRRRAKELNRDRQGDQAAFFLKKVAKRST